jgi:hypothetical protein
MGTRFSIAHEFDTDPQTYWDIFWNEDFMREMFEQMKCARKVLELRDEPDKKLRNQEVSPERDIPGVLKKVIPGGALRYIEYGVWQKPLGPLAVDIKVPAVGERFSMKCAYTVTAIGPGRCRRDFAGECTVKVPLMGGAVEKAVIDSMRDSYEVAARVHREWLARRK